MSKMNRIKELRIMQGINQVELARRAKIASPNLSAIENGRLSAWPKAKRDLARALYTNEQELFPEDSECKLKG